MVPVGFLQELAIEIDSSNHLRTHMSIMQEFTSELKLSNKQPDKNTIITRTISRTGVRQFIFLLHTGV